MKNILFLFRSKDNIITLRSMNIPGFEQHIYDMLKNSLKDKYCVYFNNDFPDDIDLDLVIIPYPCFPINNIDEDRLINIPAEMFSTLNIHAILGCIENFEIRNI